MKLYNLVFIFVLCGCSPLIKKTITDTSMKPLSDSAEVVVVTVDQPKPDSCKIVGTLHYGNNGASPSWGITKILQEAKKEARTMGGNVIKITGIQPPAEGYSNSYNVFIDVLYRQNLTNIPNRLKVIKDSLHKLKFPGINPTYAILYIYRPPGMGALIGYNVRLNDSIICRAKNDSYYEIKLYKEGRSTFSATTETTSSATIDVKFGEEYYLKCTIRMGAIVGEPNLWVVPDWQGITEYEQVKKNILDNPPSKVNNNDDNSGN